MNHSGQSAEAETFSLHGFFWPPLRIHIFLAFKASVINYFSFRQCEAGISLEDLKRLFDFCGYRSDENFETENSTTTGCGVWCAPFFVLAAEGQPRDSHPGAGE